MSKKATTPKRLTPKEALYAFVTYLSGRKYPVIFSQQHNKQAITPLISAFCRVNGFPDVRDNYELAVAVPNDLALEKVTNDPALASAGVARTYTTQEALDAVLPIILNLDYAAQTTVVAKILLHVRDKHQAKLEHVDQRIGELRDQLSDEAKFLATLDKIAKGEVVII